MKRLVLITLLVVELVIFSDCCCGDGREKSGEGARKSEISNNRNNKKPIGTPPEGMELNPFYKKYLDCDGIAVISSERVDDRAFYQVKKLLDKMLETRPDVRKALVEDGIVCHL